MATTVANPTDLSLASESVANSQPPALAAGQTQTIQTTAAPGLTTSSMPSARDVLAQPAVRKSMPAIIGLLTLAIFIIAYSWVKEPLYRAVYPGLSESDRQAAFEALSGAAFGAKIDSKTGELKVPDGRYHEARIFLAAQGLPQGGAMGGIDSLSDDASMTTSQFMEQVRYVSAMEHELGRSVTQISTVKAARVHLASPKQSVFARNRTPAKASVVVTPYPGRLVSASQVEAIVHMIASSIPYLSAEDVVVVDQRGKLLTDANNFASMQLNSVQTEHKQRLEENYRNRIDALLSPVVGTDNVRSEVDVVIDFTETESTYEEFDGNDNGPLARSEILTIDKGASQDASGVPGATSNTAPATPTAILDGQLVEDIEGDGLSMLSSKTTRNYEMDRAVRHVKRRGGIMERISVAVVINQPTAQQTVGEDGELVTGDEAADGFTDLELERFTNLVKGVVGFDERRGDVVTIVAAKFEKPLLLDSSGEWYENTQVTSMIKSLGAALVFIALLLIVVRPVIASYLPQLDLVEDDGPSAPKDGELTQEELNMIEMGDGESLEDIKAKLKPKKSTISADMLDTANTYDDKVALVRMLVAEDSGRVANVLKKMIRPI
ncbi:MAG: flagellar basal-body MS-ring/collar protein FliF [Porticoccaceae bacterium]|jgi:flagellar M-ring protein FliF|tara:strand:- start:2 stop:1825 length:1824 start_codon:yes stop_codon:yes gene_type:complete